MSYDSGMFQKFARELETLDKRRAVVIAELARLFGATFPKAGIVDPAQKPKVKAKKVTAVAPLQPKVLSALGSKPKSLMAVTGSIARHRKGTKPAAVASVLYHLVKQGKVVRVGDLFALAALPEPEVVTRSKAQTKGPQSLGAVATSSGGQFDGNQTNEVPAAVHSQTRPAPEEVLEDA